MVWKRFSAKIDFHKIRPQIEFFTLDIGFEFAEEDRVVMAVPFDAALFVTWINLVCRGGWVEYPAACACPAVSATNAV